MADLAWGFPASWGGRPTAAVCDRYPLCLPRCSAAMNGYWLRAIENFSFLPFSLLGGFFFLAIKASF
jgi:hypothetical protein